MADSERNVYNIANYFQIFQQLLHQCQKQQLVPGISSTLENPEQEILKETQHNVDNEEPSAEQENYAS